MTARLLYICLLLMRNNPDMKITLVYIEAGFANENTFFRAFKSHTSLTPTEWKSQG